ncbi:ferric-chelate reductase 1-like [Ptychodera flava]|uniref:ferric-chelate reductase 1-like n=1 Tax=Ptychodera flava TaxID=63121 RepID=UPI003969E1D0
MTHCIVRSGLFAVLLLLGGAIQICLAMVTSEGCGETKQCFQMPYGCQDITDCEAIVSWRLTEDGNAVIFELLGDMRGRGGAEEYMAIGFSHDHLMADTDVWACAAESDTSLHLDHSFNVVHHNNEQKEVVGVEGFEARITDGKIECTFERANSIDGDGSDTFFDLDADSYYLMVARGRLDRDNKKIHKHFATPMISPEKINFTKTEFTYMPSPEPTVTESDGDGALTYIAGRWFTAFAIVLTMVFIMRA